MSGAGIILGVLLGLSLIVIGLLVVIVSRVRRTKDHERKLEALAEQSTVHKATLELIDQHIAQAQNQFVTEQSKLRDQITENFGEHRTRAAQQDTQALKTLQDSMQKGYAGLQQQLGESLLRSSTDLGQRVQILTKATDDRLKEIGGQVDKRLSEGFEKTTETFTDVVKRLALIDEAQKKITSLSTEVVSLQQLLADKRSRGAWGEVQLDSLVMNYMPPKSFAFQHTLPNGKIVDCILFSPTPTGDLCIDAKFPLESYQTMTDMQRTEAERKNAETQFKQDIKKHIKDITEKYIIHDVTADIAIMFIPAEAVFAEIHAHHPDLVEIARKNRVLLTSPSTLWAILNTAASAIKDVSTREQVHIIQKQLGGLSENFRRFRTRMEALAKHIGQANKDVEEVGKSAKKIGESFDRIERVELDEPEALAPGIDHKT